MKKISFAQAFTSEVIAEMREQYQIIKKIFSSRSPAEIVIHNNNDEVFKQLGKEGLAIIYYTPIPPKQKFAIRENACTYIEQKSEKKFEEGYNPNKTLSMAQIFNKMEKYKIPKDKLDIVFNMVDKKANPKDIVRVLT